MPYDSNGNYTLPDTYFVENGDTVLPIQHNPPLEDIQAALSATLLRSGVAPMTGNLNMGSFGIKNIADGALGTDGASVNQIKVTTLEAGSISNAGAKDFNLTTYLADGYSEFEIVLSDIIAQTDGQTLIMVVSTNGGSSFLSTGYSTVFQTTLTTGAIGATGAPNGINFSLGTLHGNAAGETDNIKCNLVISASSISVNTEGSYWLSTTDDFLMLKHTGRHNTAGINAVRFLFSSGNISSGKYILRGKKGTA